MKNDNYHNIMGVMVTVFPESNELINDNNWQKKRTIKPHDNGS